MGEQLASGHRHTVLVVDDDEQVIKNLHKLLSSDGHEVLTATSGKDALVCLQQTVPCMVLLDVMMPEMDGLALCRRIKQDPRTADIPVAIVTGQIEAVDVERGLAAGAIDYIKKPFDPDELRVRVRSQIRLHEVLQIQRRIEKHLALISSAAKDAVIMIDNDGAITDWNEASTTMFGYAECEAIGRNLHDLIAPERYHPTYLSAFSRFRESGHGGAIGRTLQLEALRKSGEEFPIELSLSATNIEGKWGAIGIVRDITERRRAEKQLENLSRYPAENPFPVLRVEPQGILQYASPSARSLLQRWGCEPGQSLPERWIQLVGEAMATGKRYEVEEDCGDRNYALVLCPLPAEGYVNIYGHDITERKRNEDDLRASKNLVTGILENIQDAYIRADNDGSIIMVSPSAVAIYGYDSMQEMIGLPTAVLFESIETRRDFIEELGRLGDVSDRIGMARRKDGGLLWVSLNARLFRDRSGQVAGAECFVRDITERKHAEEALKNSEAQLRAILDTTPFPVALVDAQDSNIEFWSRSARALFGHTASSVSEWYQLAYPDPDYQREVIERWKPAVEMARSSNQPINAGEFQVTCRDGSVRICELYAAFLPGRLIVTFNDITERKEVEESIRENAFLLSESQRVGHVGSWLWDLQGPILWSDEMFRLYGVSLDTFTPTVESLVSLIHPDDRWTMQTWIAACASAQHPSELEYRCIMPDGTVRHFAGRGQLVYGVGNRPTHMAGTVQDITRQKESENEKEKLEEQLRASQKMEAIGRLAGGVAHDFNNLLSVILLYNGFAKDGATDRAKNDLVEVKKAADRGVALVRQLLAFSRKQVLQPVPLDLTRVIGGVQNMLRRVLGEDIDLVPVLTPNLGLTLADPSQIEQVLMNLVVNARDAMPEGGKLTIETSDIEIDERGAADHMGARPGSYVQLVVSDTGHGMDEQTRARIFEPFYTTKGPGKGTGLGLSTVFGIVKQSGGNIWVYSKPGNGTTFKIHLPREYSTGVATSFIPPPTSRQGAGAETILVVEDDEALLKAAERTLIAVGYTVLTAANGDDAILTCAQHTGDLHLLLTDVVMPHMSGKALAEKLLEVRPTLKVLFTSGYTDNIVDQHGVLSAGTHFIGKPFTAADLARMVREVLDLT